MPESRLSFYQGDERVRQSESIDKLAPAFLAAQREIKAADRSGTNPRFQNRPYATRDDVIQACKEVLHRNGLAFTQGAEVEGDYVVVKTRIIHGDSGQWFETGVPFKPPAEDPQKVGGVMTYGSRYGLVATVGLEGEEDDDANSVSPEPGQRGGYRDAPAPSRSSAPRPVQNQQRSGGGSSGGGSNGRYGNLPRSGRQMFPWAKTQGEENGVDLVKYLNTWSKMQDFPFKMTEWSDEQVAMAVQEAVRKLDTLPRNQQADDGGQDDEADFNF